MTLLFPLRPPATPEERDERLMQRALREARAAFERQEVPVGAIVVLGNELLGTAGNQVEALRDATAHAEMLALTQAFASLGAKRLENAEVYCTLEPCLQCAGALLHARVKRVVFGAPDPKFGGVISLAQLFDLPRANHRITWHSGVLEEEAAALLREFFRLRRKPASGSA